MNLQPEVKTGLVVRPLPLDLRDPLPVTQTPGETVSVPLQISEEGTLRAEAEDGSLMEVSLDNGPWQKKQTAGAGRHTVSVRSTSRDTINYALMVEPHRLNPGMPLPPISQVALAGLPDFPVLTDNKPLFFDLERNSLSNFIIRAEKPDLYHIQSTGLLALAETSAAALRQASCMSLKTAQGGTFPSGNTCGKAITRLQLKARGSQKVISASI